MQNRLAENIRLLRQQKNLTQAALAEVFDLNRTTVSAWEDGRAEPRVALLLALASYFEITLDVLIFSDLTVGWAPPSSPQKTNTKKATQTHMTGTARKSERC
jgi:transcriptional regulator with XRE-family HTH domain